MLCRVGIVRRTEDGPRCRAPPEDCNLLRYSEIGPIFVSVSKLPAAPRQGRLSLPAKRSNPRIVVVLACARARDDGSTGAQLALNRKAHPAAAGGDRIRVLDPKRLAHKVVDEIEL